MSQQLSFNFHETEPVGKTMTRFIGDANTLNDFLTNQMANVFTRCHVGVMVHCADARDQPGAALIALFMLPMLTILGIYMRPRLYDGWERGAREYDALQHLPGGEHRRHARDSGLCRARTST